MSIAQLQQVGANLLYGNPGNEPWWIFTLRYRNAAGGDRAIVGGCGHEGGLAAVATELERMAAEIRQVALK